MKRVMATVLLCVVCSSSNAALDTELVVNGNAETQDTTGWLSSGIVASRVFDEDDADANDFVFWAPPGDDRLQTLEQTIDVSEHAELIDDNQIKAHFRASLKSRAEAYFMDVARVDVTFYDVEGTLLDLFSFTDEPTLETDWGDFESTRQVPVGTRAIDIVLSAIRRDGGSTGALFDDVSLQLEGSTLQCDINDDGEFTYRDYREFVRNCSRDDDRSYCDWNSDGDYDFWDHFDFWSDCRE